MNKEISITINGEVYQQSVPIRMLLVDFIRDVAGAHRHPCRLHL